MKARCEENIQDTTMQSWLVCYNKVVSYFDFIISLTCSALNDVHQLFGKFIFNNNEEQMRVI